MSVVNLKLNSWYKTTECITCGVTIVLPSEFYDQRLADGKSYFCPSGHNQYFTRGQTEEAKLKKKLEIANRGKEFAERQAENARANERYQKNCARAQKAAKTRMKNRIKNGVCPCCNRTFKQLAAHMKAVHPDYVIKK